MKFIAYTALAAFLIYGHWVRNNIRRQYRLHAQAPLDIGDPFGLLKLCPWRQRQRQRRQRAARPQPASAYGKRKTTASAQRAREA